jgi:hypothetical protein
MGACGQGHQYGHGALQHRNGKLANYLKQLKDTA